MKISTYTKRALLGGAISLAIILSGTFLLGKLSGYEAKILIRNSLTGMNTLCNTIALASATILALLLTLLGISSSSKSKLKKDHYRHILQIAKLDTFVFVAAVITFLIFNLPITESESVPYNWFNFVYYISLAISSVLSSLLIGTPNRLNEMFSGAGLGIMDHPLVSKEVEEE